MAMGWARRVALPRLTAMKSVVIALAAALALCACATSRVAPVRSAPAAEPQARKICVVDNPRVKNDFLEAYTKALSEKGYDVTVFAKTPPASQCPLVSRYTATWAWDMVFYLAYAELRVYRDGKPAGRAEFRARGSRFIDTETKVKELVDRLLP